MTILISCAVSQIGLWLLKDSSGREIPFHATYHNSRFASPIGPATWSHWNLRKNEPPTGPESIPNVEAVIHCGPLSLATTAVSHAAELGAKTAVAFSSSSIRFRDIPAPLGAPDLVTQLKSQEEAFKARCRSANVRGILFRPTLIYGAAMDRNISRLANSIRNLPIVPIPRAANGLRQPVHAADLAQAAMKAVQCAPEIVPLAGGSRTIYLGGGEVLAYRDMIARVALILRRATVTIPMPDIVKTGVAVNTLLGGRSALAAMIGRTGLDQVVDNDEARSALLYDPREFCPTKDELLRRPNDLVY